MCRLIYLFALVCMTNVVFSYIKLTGNLAESTGMPITLHCHQELGYILVGGITVNNKQMNKDLQEKTMKQCDNQMNEYEKAKTDPSKKPPGEGTSCTLSLPRKDVGDDDMVRVVYSCHKAKPSSDQQVWGEDTEHGKPIEERTSTIPEGQSGSMSCQKKNEIISVDSILLNGQIADTSVHSDLDPQKMTDSCYKQSVDLLQNGQQNNVLCNINNNYNGGPLVITYSCLGPGQQRKEMGTKNTNGNSNGNNNGGNNENNGGNNGNNGGNNGGVNANGNGLR